MGDGFGFGVGARGRVLDRYVPLLWKWGLGRRWGWCLMLSLPLNDCQSLILCGITAGYARPLSAWDLGGPVFGVGVDTLYGCCYPEVLPPTTPKHPPIRRR